MRLAPCRDCGLEIDLDSRGCPRCARNLDAERIVAQVARTLVVLLVAVVLLIALYLVLRRT